MTTRNLSIPIAILVKTLAATDNIWIKRTNGQNTSENIHVRNIASAKVKGMQNAAIKRSASARLIRKGLKSVLDLLPFLKTITTNMLPTRESRVVKEYRTINPTKGP
ncbi:Hypothetical predicted protein [Mytilus galloprovincialis]|uniref:Uncharacterized protein n=1 Tax=Mytilus galloprovincialis TaxID=29158 RepID=A0A8B6BLY9_MYTGA|nr:Hypothetical predicted protein [Mytilus galloprovincialis]